MGSMFGLSASTAPPSPPDANSSALSSRDPTRFESPSYPLQRKSSPLSGSHPATNDRAGQWEGFGGKTRRVIALGETHGDRWYLMFASFGFEPGTPGMGTGGQTRPPTGRNPESTRRPATSPAFGDHDFCQRGCQSRWMASDQAGSGLPV